MPAFNGSSPPPLCAEVAVKTEPLLGQSWHIDAIQQKILTTTHCKRVWFIQFKRPQSVDGDGLQTQFI